MIYLQLHKIRLDFLGLPRGILLVLKFDFFSQPSLSLDRASFNRKTQTEKSNSDTSSHVKSETRGKIIVRYHLSLVLPPVFSSLLLYWDRLGSLIKITMNLRVSLEVNSKSFESSNGLVVWTEVVPHFCLYVGWQVCSSYWHQTQMGTGRVLVAIESNIMKLVHL